MFMNGDGETIILTLHIKYDEPFRGPNRELLVHMVESKNLTASHWLVITIGLGGGINIFSPIFHVYWWGWGNN